MRRFGSQTRETLEEASYTLIENLGDGEVILRNESGDYELWFLSDDHSGYVIEINGKGYEFARTIRIG